MKKVQIECSETSAHKIQTPGNHPKERIQLNMYTLCTEVMSSHIIIIIIIIIITRKA
jgi:hypothetical protein